ncbi:hypothetical protein EPO34_02110 [Patescibacteria group bacterium]|nr:MAG: hypothetical protein EPO34_02110 [Patescibacteria group bacterium]
MATLKARVSDVHSLGRLKPGADPGTPMVKHGVIGYVWHDHRSADKAHPDDGRRTAHVECGGTDYGPHLAMELHDITRNRLPIYTFLEKPGVHGAAVGDRRCPVPFDKLREDSIDADDEGNLVAVSVHALTNEVSAIHGGWESRRFRVIGALLIIGNAVVFPADDGEGYALYARETPATERHKLLWIESVHGNAITLAGCRMDGEFVQFTLTLDAGAQDQADAA